MKTFVAAGIMATSLGTPALSQASVPPGYQYINYSGNSNAVFYGKIRIVNGEETILSIYTVEEDNKQSKSIKRINCKQRTLYSDGKWETFTKNKIGYDWIEFACKGSKPSLDRIRLQRL